LSASKYIVSYHIVSYRNPTPATTVGVDNDSVNRTAAYTVHSHSTRDEVVASF